MTFHRGLLSLWLIGSASASIVQVDTFQTPAPTFQAGGIGCPDAQSLVSGTTLLDSGWTRSGSLSFEDGSGCISLGFTNALTFSTGLGPFDGQNSHGDSGRAVIRWTPPEPFDISQTTSLAFSFNYNHGSRAQNGNVVPGEPLGLTWYVCEDGTVQTNGSNCVSIGISFGHSASGRFEWNFSEWARDAHLTRVAQVRLELRVSDGADLVVSNVGPSVNGLPGLEDPPSPTPEVPTSALMASGMGALAVWRFKRRRTVGWHPA